MADPNVNPQPMGQGPITPDQATWLTDFLRKSGITTSIAARASGTADTSIAGLLAAQEKVQFNANEYADGITWDGANHRFVITTAGKYLISTVVGYTGTADGKQYRAMIYKNGSEVARSSVHAGATGAVSVALSDILDLAVNDYVEIFTENSEAVSGTLYNTSNQTYMAIAKI